MRPINLKAHEVRAILAGRQTQLRRVMKPQPADDIARATMPNPDAQAWRSSLRHTYGPTTVHVCPFGKPGDLLWGRETWARNLGTGSANFIYRADHPPGIMSYHRADLKTGEWTDATDRWRPSTNMPRSASRITLRVESVRVERLREISEADAMAEGVAHSTINDPRVEYRCLWESIHGADSWDANPWAWVLTFSRVGTEG